jgi:PAS domain S-box-containing protein
MKYKQYIKSNFHVISLIGGSLLLIIFGLSELLNLERQNINQLAHNTQLIYEHPFVVHTSALKLQVITTETNIKNQSLLINLKPIDNADINDINQVDIAKIDQLIHEIEVSFLGDKSKSQALRAAIEQWIKNVNVFRSLVKEKQLNEALSFMDEQLTPSFNELIVKNDYILNFSENKAAAIYKASQINLTKAQQDLSRNTLIFFLFFSIVGLVGTIYLLRLLYLKDKYLIQQRTTAELLSTNKEYKKMAVAVQTTTNAVTITDRFAHLLWVNPAFLSTCGYTEDFVIGKTAGSFLQGADTSQDTVKIMREAIKNHKGFDVEILNYKKSGELFWQHIIATPILYEDGSAGYVSIQEDITQRKIINKMKSEFVSTAAHELRTPLTVISGYIELLIMDIGSKDEQREMLSTIHSQSQAMTHLLNDMLDIARIEAQAVGLYQMALQPIGPRLQTLADTFISQDNPNKVTLVLSPNLPEVKVDIAKLEQAIYNCLSNAYKFSPKRGEVTMRVTEVTHDKQRKVLIAIEDQGIGMTPGQLERVFEKFYRADPSGAIPGTGLGLAITKEIITHHGGTIEIESEYDVGTKVMLYLPVAS